MFTLTSAAAAEILAAMPRSGADGLALRVAARLENDGSLAFGMGFDEPREGDMPLEIEGVSDLNADRKAFTSSICSSSAARNALKCFLFSSSSIRRLVNCWSSWARSARAAFQLET